MLKGIKPFECSISGFWFKGIVIGPVYLKEFDHLWFRSKESDSNQKSKLNVKRSLCVKHVEKDLLQIMCYKIILFNVRLFLHIRLNSGGKKHFLCSICNKQFDIVFNLLIQRNRPRGPEEKNFVNMHPHPHRIYHTEIFYLQDLFRNGRNTSHTPNVWCRLYNFDWILVWTRSIRILEILKELKQKWMLQKTNIQIFCAPKGIECTKIKEYPRRKKTFCVQHLQ